LLEAAEFVRTLDKRQGVKIASPEEVAYRAGWIGDADLEKLAAGMNNSDYARYLRQLLETKPPAG
jgi:glucose-1-phosphate thymidylyltransferase